ncbi:ku70-like protein [Panus rudis PR-1116 ss-1]|nr:ku70-like protein [Panus rudis PR-1116 ss-1]
MAPYDDWNIVDNSDDDDELQDESFFESKKDVILFAIDCSESMLKLYDHPEYEDLKTCHVFTALEAAVQIQKKKVIVGPNDSVGIMLFNTTLRNDPNGQGAELKNYTYCYQPIGTVNAETIKKLIHLLDEARENPDALRENFPPVTDTRVPMGDVFTSCNWIMRDGAPKTASKRVFLITDEDDPHADFGKDSERLLTSARTNVMDLTQAGILVEPFFISTEDKPFDQTKFYSSVLLSSGLGDDETDPNLLPDTISITRIEELLAQMRFHEVPKRALFSVTFELFEKVHIGVKGYGLITEQKRGAYKYFADLGERMDVAASRTIYVDEAGDDEVDRRKIVYGVPLGETAGGTQDEDESDGEERITDVITRRVPARCKVFYTAEEIKKFRTFGLEPGIKLLGFKKLKSSLAFEDNVKHSIFIHPDEMRYSGSNRTFNALLKSMVKRKRMGIVRTLLRRNSAPIFCALLPQVEKNEEDGWSEPAGFHLIPLPFADDIRAAPFGSALRAADETKDVAVEFVEKLTIKKGGSYDPDNFPNPALAYHNAQLEAAAFRDDFDPTAFKDETLPKYNAITKRVGPLLNEWRQALANDPASNIVDLPSDGKKKRKAEESTDTVHVKSLYASGDLSKLKVDQLKDFCRANALPVSGKKADLIDRIGEYLDTH